MPMGQSSPEASVIKAYWQPGCTSCLRMKEFLTKHGVPFVSVNVLEDKDAFAELAMLGIRSVPIVRRGLGERPAAYYLARSAGSKANRQPGEWTYFDF